MARSVSERTREVGIRIALGGQPSRVWLGLVIASLRAVLSGAGVGAILSFALDTGIVRLLPELRAGDWTFRVAAGAGPDRHRHSGCGDSRHGMPPPSSPFKR